MNCLLYLTSFFNNSNSKTSSLKRFLKDKNAINHFPAEGEGTLSGIIVEADHNTGLAKKITRLIEGGSLNK